MTQKYVLVKRKQLMYKYLYSSYRCPEFGLEFELGEGFGRGEFDRIL